MKTFVKLVIDFAGVSIGWSAGKWFWEDVMADKAKGIKESISKKFSNEEEGA